jgi:acetyl esterase/lipase
MPSWQARTLSTIIRLMMKRRPEGGEKEIVEFIRRKFDPPKIFRLPAPRDAKVRQVHHHGVRGEWVEWTDEPQHTIYYLHGGGYVACSPATHRAFTIALSRAARARVFAIDYRLAPEHRFPAAVEDAISGYRWLINRGEDPDRMAIGGDSAGGGLTMATLIGLRDRGVPLPRAAFCLSPWADMTVTGRSITTNDGIDSMFFGEGISRMAPVYLGDASPTDPLASPIYADLSRLPPTLIYASSSEVLLDDAVRLADRAKQCGVNVDLRVLENLPHVWPIFIGFKLPEARKAIGEIADFIENQIATKASQPSAA